MPVIQGYMPKAVRALRGDPTLTSSDDVNGFPTNVEFRRIYFGEDLKFDILDGDWLVLRNNGTKNITFSAVKYGNYGLSQDDDAPGIFMIIQNQDGSYGSQTALTYSNSYTIYPGRLLALRNYHTNSVNGGTNNTQFSLSDTKYIHFSVSGASGSGTSKLEITGTWSALAPAISNATQPTVPAYCFYKLFENEFSGIDQVIVKAELTGGDRITEVGAFAFADMFAGSYISSWVTTVETFGDCDQGAFLNMFADSSISKGMFVKAFGNLYDAATINEYGVFEKMYKNCSNLIITAPSVGKASVISGEIVMDPCYGRAYYQTFYGCTGISRTNMKIAVHVLDDAVSIIGYSSLYETFRGCTSLTAPPEIEQSTGPAQKPVLLVGTCGMLGTFYGCTNLRYMIWGKHGAQALVYEPIDHKMFGQAPVFRIRGERSLYRTFASCTSLTSSDMYDSREDKYYPGAANISIEGSCENDNMYEMFAGCTSLTDMREIFNTLYPNASTYAFYGMFSGCTNLLYCSLDGIEGSTASFCFENMFRNCSSLVQCEGSVPPVGTGGCSYMFYGCSSLLNSPYLSMSTVPTDAYNNMFYGCSSLKVIITNQDQQGSNTVEWTHGVPNGGTGSNARYYIKTNTSNTGTQQNTSGNASNAHYIPYNWNILDNFLEFSSKGDFKIKLAKHGSPREKTVRYLNLGDTVPTLKTFTSNTYNTWIQCYAYKPFLIQAEDASRDSSFSTSASDYYQFAISDSEYGVNCNGTLGSLLKTANNQAPLNWSSYTFYKLFYGCSDLRNCPDLVDPGGSLTTNRYEYAFAGSGIFYLPANPITDAHESDFSHAFSNCLGIKTPGMFSLSGVTHVANHAFEGIFEGCTGLGTLPEDVFGSPLVELPSSSSAALSYGCFANMYQGCTNIKSIPEGYLPWTSLARECYREMFKGCSSLTDVPKNLLPATTLDQNSIMCYYGMFENCTSLEKGPKLPATGTITDGPYLRMFAGCTNLNEIEVSFTDWGDAWLNQTQRNTADWVYGVATTNGTFKCPTGLANNFNNSGNTGNSVTGQNVSDASACYIPYGWTVVQPTQIPSDRFRLERVSGTTTMSGNTYNSYPVYQFSTDGTNWQNITNSVSIHSGRPKICIRRNPVLSGSYLPADYRKINLSSSGTVNVKGNLAWLINSSGSNDQNMDFSRIFENCTNIRDCSDIYFSGNPLVTLDFMFFGSSITSINKNLIRYTRVYSASQMFKSCSSLTSGMDLVCYNETIYPYTFDEVYRWCTSLQSPNTTSCISIGSTATSSPRIQQAAFRRAFDGCNSSSFNKIEIFNMCYLGDKDNTGMTQQWERAFNGCSHLTTVVTGHRRWPGIACTLYWLDGVSSTGTFYLRPTDNVGRPAATKGIHNIPTGWNVVRSNPGYSCD